MTKTRDSNVSDKNRSTTWK